MFDKRILLVDNNLTYLETTTSLLRAYGYTVVSCDSISSARQVLSEQFFNFLICDNRLVDDNDVQETSGLDFLLSDFCGDLPRVLNTAWGGTETELKALRGNIKLISKTNDIVSFTNNLFEKFEANWNLEIKWPLKKEISTFHILSLLAGTNAQKDLRALEQELAYLFARLFNRRTQIRIDRVLWSRPQRVALVVYLFSSSGQPESRVVIIGNSTIMEKADQDYKNFSPGATANNTIMIDQMVTGSRLAARSLKCVAKAGQELDEFSSLAEIRSTTNTEKMLHIIGNLEQYTLSSNRGAKGPETSIRQFYSKKLNLETEGKNHLDAVIQRIKTLALKSWIRWTEPEGAINLHIGTTDFLFSDPRALLNANFDLELETLATPGQLLEDNILTDGQETWLTDFYGAGMGPAIRDYVSMEAIFRYKWYPPMDLERSLKDERSLVSAPFLEIKGSEKVENHTLLMQKIRDSYLSQFENEEAYHFGMFFLALKHLLEIELDIELMPNELNTALRILSSAGFYADRFLGIPRVNTTPDTRQPRKKSPTQVPLKQPLANLPQMAMVDDRIYLNGNPIQIKGQQKLLLQSLYNKINDWCQKEDLGQKIWPDLEPEKQRLNLNNLAVRLRRSLDDTENTIIENDPIKGWRLHARPAIG